MTLHETTITENLNTFFITAPKHNRKAIVNFLCNETNSGNEWENVFDKLSYFSDQGDDGCDKSLYPDLVFMGENHLIYIEVKIKNGAGVEDSQKNPEDKDNTYIERLCESGKKYKKLIYIYPDDYNHTEDFVKQYDLDGTKYSDVKVSRITWENLFEYIDEEEIEDSQLQNIRNQLELKRCIDMTPFLFYGEESKFFYKPFNYYKEYYSIKGYIDKLKDNIPGINGTSEGNFEKDWCYGYYSADKKIWIGASLCCPGGIADNEYIVHIAFADNKYKNCGGRYGIDGYYYFPLNYNVEENNVNDYINQLEKNCANHSLTGTEKFSKSKIINMWNMENKFSRHIKRYLKEQNNICIKNLHQGCDDKYFWKGWYFIYKNDDAIKWTLALCTSKNNSEKSFIGIWNSDKEDKFISATSRGANNEIEEKVIVGLDDKIKQFLDCGIKKQQKEIFAGICDELMKKAGL